MISLTKKLFIAALVMAIDFATVKGLAAVDSAERLPNSSGKHSVALRFTYKSKSITLDTQARDFNEALPQLAQRCFDHFKKDVQLNETTGLDIIDACANPKQL